MSFRVEVVTYDGKTGHTSYEDKESARQRFKWAVSDAMFNPKVSDVLLVNNDTGQAEHHWKGAEGKRRQKGKRR